MTTICKKCNSPLHTDYCSACGHPAVPQRIDSVYIIEELRSVFNFERGIFFTLKALLTAPGDNVRVFIEEDRDHLVKPILFLIICSLAYTFVLQSIGVDLVYEPVSEEDKTLTIEMFAWIINNTGYSNIMMSVFIGAWLQVFFRKHNFNFFEILILLCFVMGIGMLIYTLFLILANLSDINFDIIASIIGFAYCAWAISSFYDGHKIGNFFKAFIAYCLGATSFYAVVFIVGTSISAML